VCVCVCVANYIDIPSKYPSINKRIWCVFHMHILFVHWQNVCDTISVEF